MIGNDAAFRAAAAAAAALPWSRVLIAIGLVGGHLMVLALATWLLLSLFAPAALAAIFALLLAACAAAKVVVSGRWSGGVAGGIQVAAVVMLCASYVVGGTLALASAADALASQSTFATPRSEAITAFLVAAIAAAAFAAVLVAVPTSFRRRGGGAWYSRAHCCIARTIALRVHADGLS